MKKRMIGWLMIAVFVVSAIFGDVPSLSNTAYAKTEQRDSFLFSVEAPEETMENKTVEVAVKITVPSGQELHSVQGTLGYDAKYFSYEDKDILGGLINESDVGNVDGELAFLFTNVDSPIPEGTHTLFRVQFTIADVIPEDEFSFSLHISNACNMLFGKDGLVSGVENVMFFTYSDSVYIGERFRVTPQVKTLYAGESTKLTFNKTDNILFTNWDEDLLDYNSETQEITAKSLPEGVKERTGTISFSHRSGQAIVEIKILAPDARLKNLTVLNADLTPEFSMDVYDYTVVLPYTEEKLQFGIVSPIDEDAEIQFDDPKLDMGETKVNTISVIARNGVTKATYKITVTREKKQEIPPPDPQPPTPPVQHILKGDVNGDGKITASDYVNVKFYVLGKQSLNETARKAADVNGDGKVTATDYVNIKFHVLGKINIAQ